MTNRQAEAYNRLFEDDEDEDASPPARVDGERTDGLFDESTPHPFEKLFEAFNLKPGEFTDHHYDHSLDADVHAFDGRMRWRSTVGEGRVPRGPMKSGYGRKIDDVVSDLTRVFEIAYTVMMPKSRSERRSIVRGINDDLPLIGMLHGVPTNRKWKFFVQKMLAQRGAIVVSFDMLGMGESSMVLDYVADDQGDNENDVNSAWDWKNDVPYVHQLFMEHIPSLPGVNRSRDKKFVLACDDWGAGIGEWYAVTHPTTLEHFFLINPIHLDGYPVIEISTIGKTDRVRRMMGNAAFEQGAFTLPQVIIGILKYMIVNRKRMNRYTESSFMFPYQDVDYQAGKDAAGMRQHFWNLAVLAARASRLAPRQLQPYHDVENPEGLRVENIKDVPIDVIWGTDDQMMPPVQMFRTIYQFPNCRVAVHPIDDADHFVEIDQPVKVVNAMVAAMLRENKEAFPPFLGVGDDYVYKGDEKEMVGKLEDIYVGAPRV